MKCIIICPYNEFKIRECVNIESGDLVICADNSYPRAESEDVNVDIAIGDFDSGDEGDMSSLAHVIRVPREKDDTDTMLCIKEAIARGYDNIVIAGGIGGRLDHTIANIQSLAYAHERGVHVELCDKNNTAFIIGKRDGLVEIKKRNGFYLSVFAYDSTATGVFESGVKYSLNNATLTNGFPLGVSNEIICDNAKIACNDGHMLVILSRKL